eukprot:scaffold14591_cov69-Cylindrotheca_fusiformis.AAC.1
MKQVAEQELSKHSVAIPTMKRNKRIIDGTGGSSSNRYCPLHRRNLREGGPLSSRRMKRNNAKKAVLPLRNWMFRIGLADQKHSTSIRLWMH